MTLQLLSALTSHAGRNRAPSGGGQLILSATLRPTSYWRTNRASITLDTPSQLTSPAGPQAMTPSAALTGMDLPTGSAKTEITALRTTVPPGEQPTSWNVILARSTSPDTPETEVTLNRTASGLTASLSKSGLHIPESKTAPGSTSHAVASRADGS